MSACPITKQNPPGEGAPRRGGTATPGLLRARHLSKENFFDINNKGTFMF